MKTIIVAGTVNRELALLTEGLPTGTLHVVEKPLVAFSIAGIQAAVKSKINIHSPDNTAVLINKLSPYLEWDVKLQAISYIVEEQSDEMLWIRDDLIYDIDFSGLLAGLRNSENHCIAIFADDMPVMFYKKCIPLILFKRVYDGEFESVYPEFKPNMSNLDYCHELLTSFEWQIMQLKDGQIHEVDTPKNYHKHSMQLIRGEFTHIALEPHQEGSPLIKGWHNSIDESSQLQDRGYFGDCVYVHKDSQIKGEVIIGKGSYIDRCVDINNTIVMPGVYVGPYLDLNEAIVTGNEVIRVDSGVVIPINDNKFIATL
ncbi:MAG: hypothetical protein IPN42_11400 [Methylococcaceae bacterium]|nr:hypothetical protein [Methylococcaceae bacterium]